MSFLRAKTLSDDLSREWFPHRSYSSCQVRDYRCMTKVMKSCVTAHLLRVFVRKNYILHC